MSELVVEFCAVAGGGAAEGGAGWTAGVVVTDVATARPVHESGHVLEAGGEGEAGYLALLRALEQIEPLEATDVELRCDSQALVDQLVGGGATEGDAAVEALFEQAMMRLLRIGLWRIRCVEAGQLQRPAELAEVAAGEAATSAAGDGSGGVVELDAEDVKRQRERSQAAGVPRWTVEFAEDAGPRCPADCRAGQRFGFGPDTPPGFCVHAMAAVVEDGPLAWQDPQQRRMFTLCPHCDVPIDIERVD